MSCNLRRRPPGPTLFPYTTLFRSNLAYGVTTTYDPSAPSLDVFAQAEMVEAGLMIGPRIYSSGDVLYGGQQTDIFAEVDRKSTRLNSSHPSISYAVVCLKITAGRG